MAVDPDHLDAVAGTVATIYREAETALVRALQKWLAGALDDQLQGPEWLNTQLAQVTTLRRAAEAVQAAVKQVADPEIKAALASAYKAGSSSAVSTILQHLDPDHPLAEAARQAQQEVPQFGAVEALANALISDIGVKSANVLRDVEDIYRAVITAGAARTVTGAQTRRQASQAAFAGLLARGVTSFTDKAGRKWRLASYVEMAVRTVTQRAAIQGEEDRLRSLGVTLVSVSNAPEECERCEPFEGRILALDPAGPTGQVKVQHQITGKAGTVTVTATLAEARLRGLFHPNCRHSISAYLPGVSTVPKPTADPVGREARIKQRALERKIRAEKLQVIGALTPEARTAAKRKVARAQAALREHLAAHPDLKRLRYREQIGAGNMPPAGHNDPASAIWPPEPEPDPEPDDEPTPVPPPPPEPEPEPEPVPEPGEQTLAALLDPNDPITAADLLDALTVHTAQPEGELRLDLDEAAAALSRFVTLADAGESGTWAKAHVKFVAKLQATSDDDLGKYVRRRLGQLRTDAQRAATMREWWRELARRAERPRTPGMRQGQRYRENTPAVKWAMAEMPQPQLTEYQRVALQAYTGSGYSFINNGLRGWQLPKGPDAQLRFDRYIEHLDAIFAKTSLDEAIIVHRGTGGSVAKALGADVADPKSMQALVGQVHVEPGYISSSIGARAAFDGQIYWMFRLPQGYQALNAMHTSVYGTKEREILIRRNARYIIHAVYQRGPSWYVEAEMVPDDFERPPDWTPDGYHDAWEGYE